MEHLPHIQKVPVTEEEWFSTLIALARFLRGPEGCPWDREQTAASFASYLPEETRELLDAFEKGDYAHAEEEFGDVFFCLLATAAAAEAGGHFDLHSALTRAHEKMIRRHDHVFGKEKASTPEEAVAAWNRIKAQEQQQQR